MWFSGLSRVVWVGECIYIVSILYFDNDFFIYSLLSAC